MLTLCLFLVAPMFTFSPASTNLQACHRELTVNRRRSPCSPRAQLPKEIAKFVPAGILAEDVWRGLGIRQSPGWEQYLRHEPVSYREGRWM